MHLEILAFPFTECFDYLGNYALGSEYIFRETMDTFAQSKEWLVCVHNPHYLNPYEQAQPLNLAFCI